MAVAGWSLLALGLAGLSTSTVYLALVLLGAARLRNLAVAERRALDEGANIAPAVTLFKPLRGAEPGLEENLRSFFAQDYPGPFEIVFGARSLSDAGMKIARRVSAEFPRVTTRFVASGAPWAANAKVCSLAAMARVAAHEVWVISDSDVRVGAGYLRQVVLPFADATVGCVTCLYRGVAATGGLWARLEAVGMSVEMPAGVAVVNLLEPMRFALGPTMAVRRGCVDEIGGFEAMADYCADDFVLGNWIQARGHRVVLSGYVVEHRVLESRLVESLRHQVRWMRSTRFSRPKGHLGTCLTFGVPFGLLAWIGALLLGRPGLGWGMLAASVAGRMVLALVMAGVVGERSRWECVLLYPLRDALGMLLWALSYAGNSIAWRGEEYVLRDGGRMERDADGRGSSRHVAGSPFLGAGD